jgi:hypothetical protein
MNNTTAIAWIRLWNLNRVRIDAGCSTEAMGRYDQSPENDKCLSQRPPDCCKRPSAKAKKMEHGRNSNPKAKPKYACIHLLIGGSKPIMSIWLRLLQGRRRYSTVHTRDVVVNDVRRGWVWSWKICSVWISVSGVRSSQSPVIYYLRDQPG